jgi:hypothetical protein
LEFLEVGLSVRVALARLDRVPNRFFTGEVAAKAAAGTSEKAKFPARRMPSTTQK